MGDDYPIDQMANGGSVAEQAAVIIIENVNSSVSMNGDGNFFTNGTASSITTAANSNGSSVVTFDVPTGLICLLAFLYGSISLLAVIGNGLVILVIVKNNRMHTVTNIFIANLAVADVIIGLFSIPFQVNPNFSVRKRPSVYFHFLIISDRKFVLPVFIWQLENVFCLC